MAFEEIHMINEGAWFHQLDYYIVLERSEYDNKVNSITFSKKMPPIHSELAQCIIDYVEGKTAKPSIELEMSDLTNFQKEIYNLAQEIPRGKTITYGELARFAKRPKAFRAVGQAMATNPFVIIVPCHRVISSKGVGGYRWGMAMKKKLITLEGGESLE
jgi:O-6-methylguanine DNA methyltransferase